MARALYAAIHVTPYIEEYYMQTRFNLCLLERDRRMPDYKKLYFHLFNQVSDAIQMLQQAQLDSEESFVADADRPQVKPLDFRRDDETPQP